MVAAPTGSMFQTACVAIRLIQDCTWTMTMPLTQRSLAKYVSGQVDLALCEQLRRDILDTTGVNPQ